MTIADSPILTVENLKVQFSTDAGTVTAVDDVSLGIRPGETLGLVGESGSGKSVTSLAVMGLLPRSRAIISGSIRARFEGGSPTELVGASPEVFRSNRGANMAMIFQEPMTSLNPVARVGDQIAEAIMVHRRMRREPAREKAIELLSTVGIPDARSRAQAYPHQLSGGMCQRVMIAMALSCEPKLLIADEPTTALDVTIQAQILDLIQEVQRKFGMAVLFITHDLGVVAEIADRVAVMYAGRIVEQSDTETVLFSSQHPYTRGLLQSIPRVEDENQPRIRAIRGMMPDARRLPQGCAFHPRCDHFVAGRCDLPTACSRLLPAGAAHGVRCERLGEIWPLDRAVA